MTTSEERNKKADEMMALMGRGPLASGPPQADSVAGFTLLAPDMRRIFREFHYGCVWSRSSVKSQHLELSNLSVLTVLEREHQIRSHINSCLDLGLTPEQVIEVFIHLAFYSGDPNSINAVGIAKEVFDHRGIQYTPQPIYGEAEDSEDMYQRGLAKRRELMGDGPRGLGGGPVTHAEEVFNRLTLEYLWGSIWTRPGLDLPSRSVCTLSALMALAYEDQLRSHIGGALHIGFTQEQIIEIFMNCTAYAGVPATRKAIGVANEMFRAG